MFKHRLLAPGPTEVPHRVLLAMAQPIVHHRHPGFAEIFREAAAGLQRVFQTNQPVLTLAASGTGAMEAALCNFLSRGERVLVVRGGKFGERWDEIARAYGLQSTCLDVEWGRAVDPDAVRRALEADPAIRAVCWQASETSTGVRHPVRELAELCRAHGALSIVDAITALGVFDLPTDAWGLDVVVTGSQKALMLPPGLAFLCASERAWQQIDRGDLPRFYWDLRRERKAQAEGQTAYTPAISLIVGLREALRMIEEEGLAQVFARHERAAAATRAAVTAMGLELYAPTAPAPGCTAIKPPAGLDGQKVVKTLREDFGLAIAGGQGAAKGKLFRISHMGWFDDLDVLAGLAALEAALGKLGFPVPPGAGVAAYQRARAS